MAEQSEAFVPSPLQEGHLVVAIGASAGGVEALGEFFASVPAGSGMAYVVLLHLPADSESHLPEILGKTSPIPVVMVKGHVTLDPDHVYVVPANRHVSAEGSHLSITQDLEVEDRRAPLDMLFRCMAQSLGPRLVGVILSGSGANGSMGIRRIKERGGAIFVQNPREALFSEMPRNAIATEMVDEILSVAALPARILDYKNGLGRLAIPLEPSDRADDLQQALREIFAQLRLRTGHDFSDYKRPTILRRIERRVNVCMLPDLPSYAALLAESPEEVDALLKDLLISVTNFFRDRTAFGAFEKEVLPAAMAEKGAGSSLRIWICACATGEEAYSIAMLVSELTSEMPNAPKIQIFATDIDESAISQAREGLYTLNDAADVTPERLRRFFTREGDNYRIRREIREMILFAHHNILKDPPFSHLDVVSCRNMLIYLNSTAQERVMETFHFSLNPGGYLFLGSSESADGSSDLYATVSREHRIYQRRQTGARLYPAPEGSPVFRFQDTQRPEPAQKREEKPLEKITYGELHQRLLEQYAPPSLVVDENFDVVHVSEQGGRYLRMTGGEPTKSLLKLIHPDLRLELRSALYQAVQQSTSVHANCLEVTTPEGKERINLQVKPVLKQTDAARGFLLVVFEPCDRPVDEAPSAVRPDEPLSRQLEEELTRAREQLRNANEQHEVQAEELKASNEELRALNEELRSASEELETSKEELQSANEELRTVNQELKVKVDEVTSSRNNFQNLINSTDIGTVFMDRSFKVNLFSPAIRNVFNLLPSDVGRPLSDITSRLKESNWLEDAEAVMERLVSIERDVETTEGRIFTMRIYPYRTADDRINGVVVTFFDVTSRRAAEQTQRESEARIMALFDSMTEAFVIKEAVRGENGAVIDYTYIDCNPAFSKQTGLADPRGRTVLELMPDVEPVWIDSYTKVLATGVPAKFEAYIGPLGRWLSVSASRVGDPGSDRVAIVFRDVTERRKSEEQMQALQDRLAAELEGMKRLHELNERLSHTSSTDTVLAEILKTAVDLTGMDRGDVRLLASDGEGQIAVQLGHGEGFLERFRSRIDDAVWAAAIKEGRRLSIEDASADESLRGTVELEVILADGIRTIHSTPLINRAGEVIGALSIYSPHPRSLSEEALRRLDLLAWTAADLIERARAHESLRRSEARMSAIFAQAEVGLSEIADDGRLLRANDKLCSILGRPREELLGRHLNDFLAPDGIGFDFSEAVEGSDEPKTFDLAFIRKDGSKVWTSSAFSRLETTPDSDEPLLAVTVDMTDRIRTQAALLESRQRLELVLESVKDYAIITTDLEGEITGWNPGAAHIFGFTEDEALGQPSSVIFTSEDRLAGVPEQEMATARDKGRAEDERWHARKDGSRVWLSGIMSPLVEGGLQAGYVKVARDLTAQRRAEAAIRESESRFRILANSLPQVVWTNEAGGRANYFNRRWYEYTGLSEEESSGLGWQAVVHPEDAARSVELWNASLTRGETFEAEFRLRGADGNYRWFIGRNVPLRDENGQVNAWFGTATDVENLKIVSQALRDSEERLRIALESAELAAWDWDIDADQVEWNERHYLILGLKPDDRKKDAAFFLQFVHPDDREELGKELMKSVAQTSRFRAEFRIVRHDTGEVRWMNGFGRPVGLKDGKSSRMTGVMFDVTDRKRTNDELESLVQARTREVTDVLARLQIEAAGRASLEADRQKLLERLVSSQEEERTRISRELHDNLSQHMVAVKMGLEALGKAMKNSKGWADGEPQPIYTELSRRIDALIQAAHRQAWELRPSELDHLGLEVAIRHYLADWSDRTGIPASFDAAMWKDQRLNPKVEISLYRLLQEALANVARHSGASNVEVRLESDTKIRLQVSDNGKGFDSEMPTPRLGIMGMQERMALLGGDLDISSSVDGGTRISAAVPRYG